MAHHSQSDVTDIYGIACLNTLYMRTNGISFASTCSTPVMCLHPFFQSACTYKASHVVDIAQGSYRANSDQFPR